MEIKEKVQRVTEKGQITLPIAWRRKVGNASAVVVREAGNVLEISPLKSLDERDEEWVSLFDAMRDNRGKGIAAGKLAKLIRKVNKET